MTLLILLIEDNVPLREMLAAMLGRAGHRVLQAGNGKQAMDHLRDVSVDLVITDIVMPDQDGIETIMLLRKTNPSVPVIAMSGDAPVNAPLYLSIAARLGAVKMLIKPFLSEALLAAITETMTEGAGNRTESKGRT